MMKPTVAVVGLWHLGTTVAACLAAAGVRVVASDPEPATVEALRHARLPVEEPGLAALVREGLDAGMLEFDTDVVGAVRGADVVWVAFDTPVDERDEPNTNWVREEIERLLPALRPGALMLVTSQVPVGFTRALARRAVDVAPQGVRFAYSPENLQLGRAIESFRRPARTVIGTETGAPDELLARLLAPFQGELRWMSLESAEMSKHALNAFLATSVAFINEVARLCEVHGADAQDVERALKSEPRIGPRAYLAPGAAFAGGTLARDLRSLQRLGAAGSVATPLLSAVLASNDEHGEWLRKKIVEVSGGLTGIAVAVLGLAYKPDTNTLRRSSALDLCRWLAERSARVRAYDPAIAELGAEGHSRVTLAASAGEALAGAEVAVVATPWPEFRRLSGDDVVNAMKTPRVIDQTRFLADTLGKDPRIAYVAVGTPAAARSQR